MTCLSVSETFLADLIYSIYQDPTYSSNDRRGGEDNCRTDLHPHLGNEIGETRMAK